MKKKMIILLIIILILAGCKSFTKEGNLLSEAKKLEDRGDSYSAAMNAIESVKIDNEYKDAINYLLYIYTKANKDLLQEINQAEYSSKEFINDDVTLCYKNLFTLNEASKTLPRTYHPDTKIMISLSYVDYRVELEESNKLSAKDHYQKGLYYLEKGGREDSKNAVKQFETALRYVPNYADANKLKEKAIKAGTQILAFLPIENISWDLSNKQFPEMIESEIISNLMANKEVMKFTKIIDRNLQNTLIQEQMGSLSAVMDEYSSIEIGKLLNANIIVTGIITSAKVEGPFTKMSEKQRTETIKIKEPVSGGNLENAAQSLDEQYNNGFHSNNADSNAQSTTYITKVVRAEIRTFVKKISINSTISYKAVDIETGAILKSDTIKIYLEDSCTWGEWNGDERALTWNDKKLIKNYERSVESSEQIATRAAKEAGKKIADSLAGYLK